MSYCTVNDIAEALTVNTLLELVNDEQRDVQTIDLEDPDDVCTMRIQKCADDATAEINTDLSNYTLPLDPVPQIITKIATEIAIKNIYEHRDRLNIPESLLSLYKMYKDMLKEFQTGTKKLEGYSEPVAEGRYLINKTENDRFFTDDVLGIL